METPSLRLARWSTHLLLALTAVWLIHAGWGLRQGLAEKVGSASKQAQITARLGEWARHDPLTPVFRFLRDLRPEDAHPSLDAWISARKKMQTTLGLPTDQAMEGMEGKLREIIREASAFSHPSEVWGTLSSKVAGLQTYATGHHWKNLAFVATRLSNRVRGIKASLKNAGTQARYALADLDQMEKLAKTLDESDEHEVLSRTGAIREEIRMITDVSSAAHRWDEVEAKATEVSTRWRARALLAAGTLKQKSEERLAASVHEVWAMLAYVLLAWAALAALWTLGLRAQRHAQDQTVLEVLRGGVLGNSSSWRQLVGEARTDEVSRLMKTARKRMGLGDDLQAAIPFGAVMVDAEGRLVWANNEFCEQFQLDQEGVLQEDRRWHEIVPGLVGIPDDLLESSLGRMEAGTYQIQADLGGVGVPFELHVSPLDGKEGRRVLMLFYPLALMREAINGQARLFAAPLRASTEALDAGAWDVGMEKRFAPLWQEAGLGNDWEKFCRAVQRLDGGRRELLERVASLEDERQDHFKIVMDLEGELQRLGDVMKGQMQRLKAVKDGFVSMDQLTGELRNDHAQLLAGARTSLKRETESRAAVGALEARLAGIKEQLAPLEEAREACRQDKRRIMEVKANLMRLHNSFLTSLDELSPESENLAASMKDELLRLDQDLARLDGKLGVLDMQAMKISMAGAGPVGLVSKPATASVDVNAHERSAAEIVATLTEDQQQVVDLLRGLVGEMRQEQTHVANLVNGEYPPMLA